MPCLILFCRLHIVADLALEADIGHDAVAGLGVDARHVARIGVAVGIAVLTVKQDNKFVTILDSFHGQFSSVISVVFFFSNLFWV